MQNVGWVDLAWIFGSLGVFVAIVKWGRSAVRLVRYARKYGLLSVHFMSSGSEIPPDTAQDLVSVSVSDTNIRRIDTAWLAANLTEDQRFEIMVLAKNERGKWAHPGKRLYATFGGNYNEFVVRVRQLRNEASDDEPDPPVVVTPIARRRTRANFHDPDPVYRPPD